MVTRLSEAFLSGEVRGDDPGSSSARETKEELASLPGTSTDIQSILVDLGRAALKVGMVHLQRVKKQKIHFLKAWLGRQPRIERSSNDSAWESGEVGRIPLPAPNPSNAWTEPYAGVCAAQGCNFGPVNILCCSITVTSHSPGTPNMYVPSAGELDISVSRHVSRQADVPAFQLPRDTSIFDLRANVYTTPCHAQGAR